ncbi:ABC transporter ATP-binding protein [Alkalicella caledoniensis]|uniref:ABC transporter ATP-binding protein n=2 Tax=Alkalicella caledoniensis TaxID=2731377 RepID=A0A7G9WDD4_ALKCA|nr:ABC transporter ATP-binding protein [Alkalicella caledoniensis]
MLSTLALTAVNLSAPRVLTSMTAMVEQGISQDQLGDIGKLTLILLGLYLFKITFRFMASYLSHKAAWQLVEDMRMKVYNKIQGFSMSFFHDKQTGDLMSRVVNDTATFELLYAHIIPETVTNVVTLVGVTVILLSINFRLALLTAIPIPFILICSWIFATKVRPNFRVMQKSLAGLNSQLQDNISGIKEIQAFGQQDRETARVEKKASIFTSSMLKALKLSAVYHPSVEFITSIGTIMVVGFGGYFAYQGQISVSDIVGFLLYLSLFYAPISGIANLLEQAQQALAGAERVLDILDTPNDIIDEPGAKDLSDVKGEIEFDNVSFHYIEESPILKNVSFTAEPGKMIALVGPTGVGKSTTTQLAARFYEPIEGTIRIDGNDLRSIKLQSLRSQIAMVLQDTFLFNGTIAENIAYPRQHVEMDEIIEAARIARIHDDIMQMPNKYETKIGERGIKLSGGQKQRLSIARAILCKAPVLILDEATASVDVETEAHIQQAINDLAGTRTIIAIAHRLSTVRKADQILVFENGEIVQRGNHDQLMAQEGLYRRMCIAQEKGAKLEEEIA